MLRQNENSEGSEGCDMDVPYISTPSLRTPARFPPPRGWVPQDAACNLSNHAQPQGALSPRQPQPSRGAVYAHCPPLMDFRHILNITPSY